MKGVSGVIGGVVVILLLLIAVSLTLAAMNYAYGVQQIEAKTFMSQLSQPHVAQVSPDSVVTSGHLVASYIIYPNGRVAILNETVSGIRSFQSYLDGNPWAVVVFSNGQWINVSNVQIQSNNWLYSGSHLVPYYPKPIDPQNTAQLAYLLVNGTEYNLPLFLVNISAIYIANTTYGNLTSVALDNLSNPFAYGFGRILEVPVVSEDGWLNFTAVSTSYYCPISLAVLVQNTTGSLVVIHFNLTGLDQYNVSYGIYQYMYIISPLYNPPAYYGIVFPNSYEPLYVLDTNLTYTFRNTSVGQVTFPYKNVYIFESPLIRVAIKFDQGQPVQMYLWIGYYDSSGISWYRVLLPGFDVPTGSVIGYVNPVLSIGTVKVWVEGYYADWLLNETRPSWPVNIYSESFSGSYAYPVLLNSVGIPGYYIHAEPLVPEPGSAIEVVPYWNSAAGTVIFNVTYSI